MSMATNQKGLTGTNTKVDSDYEDVRKQLFDLAEQGDEAIELMLELARESEHPRAFEVLSKAIKDIGDVTDKLMDLQKSNRDLNDENKGKKEVTNNNLFVGSTTDLQRLFMKHDKENKDKKIIDATPEE